MGEKNAERSGKPSIRRPASGVARFQAIVFSLRNALAALPVVVLFLASPGSAGVGAFAAGAALVLLGAMLRAWCTLYNHYAQGGDKKTLAVGGPYSWVRNPLYVGNTLILLGCTAVSGALWALPLTLAWSGVVYGQVVRHEERRLLAKYGAAYADYRTQVPAWLPRRLGERPAGGMGPLLPALLVQARALALPLCFLAKDWLIG